MRVGGVYPSFRISFLEPIQKLRPHLTRNKMES